MNCNTAKYDEARKRFDDLPIVHAGESKVVRAIDEFTGIVKLRPTLFSYTANRASEVEGTQNLRLIASKILWNVVADSGIKTAIRHVGEDYYVCDLVRSPPIEVIVKAAFVGTPKHIYNGMENHPTRHSTSFQAFKEHPPYVRFDWRNPLPGKDECLPESLADYFIDTKKAKKTALNAFMALQKFLADREIQLLDICFFIDESGEVVFGEISPDCMRAKLRGQDLDKDLWRKGRDDRVILKKWSKFVQLIDGREFQNENSD